MSDDDERETSDDMVAAVTFSRSRAAALRHPRYGDANSDPVHNDFWDLMIRQRRNGHWARKTFGFKETDWTNHRIKGATSAWRDELGGPVFSFDRYGRTVTQLPDGRTIYVAGEHEDSYDPDFCIYNDVVVERPGQPEIEIYAYPKHIFPPTDFHTATLVGDKLYLIGSLGYADLRRPGETQVYVVDTEGFAIREFPTAGDGPGWISRHTAEYERSLNAIRVIGGDIAIEAQKFEENDQEFLLDLGTGLWRSSASVRLR